MWTVQPHIICVNHHLHVNDRNCGVHWWVCTSLKVKPLQDLGAEKGGGGGGAFTPGWTFPNFTVLYSCKVGNFKFHSA